MRVVARHRGGIRRMCELCEVPSRAREQVLERLTRAGFEAAGTTQCCWRAFHQRLRRLGPRVAKGGDRAVSLPCSRMPAPCADVRFGGTAVTSLVRSVGRMLPPRPGGSSSIGVSPVVYSWLDFNTNLGQLGQLCSGHPMAAVDRVCRVILAPVWTFVLTISWPQAALPTAESKEEGSDQRVCTAPRDEAGPQGAGWAGTPQPDVDGSGNAAAWWPLRTCSWKGHVAPAGPVLAFSKTPSYAFCSVVDRRLISFTGVLKNCVMYTYHRIYCFNHFKVSNLVAFCAFTLLCNHHLYLLLKCV